MWEFLSQNKILRCIQSIALLQKTLLAPVMFGSGAVKLMESTKHLMCCPLILTCILLLLSPVFHPVSFYITCLLFCFLFFS